MKCLICKKETNEKRNKYCSKVCYGLSFTRNLRKKHLKAVGRYAHKIAIISLLLIVTPCFAEEVDLRIIAQIESNNNPLAYNRSSGASGLYQQTQICVDDYNNFHYNKYKLKDMFNPVNSEIVAKWYFKRINQMLDSYDIPKNELTIIASYNWGIGNVVKWHRMGNKYNKLPKETRGYYEKYVREKQSILR